MKNILIAIPCLLIGGTEYQTYYTVKALLDYNYKVTVVCYFEYDEYMIDLYKNIGADVILLSRNKKRPPTLYKTAKFIFSNIKSIIKTTKYDVVHLQYMAPGSLAFVIFKILGFKRIIVHAHTPGHIYKYKIIPKMIMKVSSCFICVSKSSEKSFFDVEGKIFNLEDYKRGRKHFTIYNSVELPKIENKKIKENKFVIGIVSRLAYEKGIDIFIRALAILKEKTENFKVIIIGDGYEKDKLIRLAKDLKVDEFIEWKGFLPKEKIVDYYYAFDVLVMPSRFEGFGLSAIEAMSYKVPVIASNIDGLNEIIENNKNGLLFNKEDSKMLSDKILTLINNMYLRKSLSECAYNSVKEKFSYEIYKEKINELYSVILKEI